MNSIEQDTFDVASGHFARLEAGLADAREQADIDAWCARAPGNRAAMDAVRKGWEASAALHGEPVLDGLMQALASRYPPSAASAIPTRSQMADAGEPAGRDDGAAPHGLEPDEPFSASVSHSVWRPVRKWAIAAGVTLAAGLGTLLWLHGAKGVSPMSPIGSGQPGRPMLADVQSGSWHNTNDLQRDVVLPDGSHMVLDGGAAVSIAFTPNQRSVDLLSGRAYFAVRKNKARPFVVAAGAFRAVAVGTAFAVAREGNSRVVTTTEGIVRVETTAHLAGSAHQALVPAGTQLQQADGHTLLLAVDSEALTRWRHGPIVFSARCLGSVVSDINRYGGVQLSVTPDAGQQAVSGVFDLDNAKGLALALEAQGLVKVTPIENGGMRLSRGHAGDSVPCNS